jgi:dolichol-phosphate mannosyltransferase
LSLAKAVVQDMPMDSIYGDEKSNIKLARVLFEFPYKHAVNFHKRLFYNYYLRDMSIASLELPIGAALWWFGVIFGAWHLIESSSSGVPATSGTVMLSAVPIILGLQLILAFFGHDMGSVPNRVRHNPKELLG